MEENRQNEIIYVTPGGVATTDPSECLYDVTEFLERVPDIAKPLAECARISIKKIKKMLCTAPAFINLVKSAIPENMLVAVFTDEQKAAVASGALKLMTKKDGSLMANLVDPANHRIVSTVPLKDVNLSPALSQALVNLSAQMQMTQIAEEIQKVQKAIEEVRQGQESDRLAMAYSCQQKLLQAISIKNTRLREMALLRLASDAEDSRNLLMLSQKANIAFIQGQPDTLLGKVLSGAAPETINGRIAEIRESLGAMNMVSLAEAMAYQEMGESEAAVHSLEYYADHIRKTFLEEDGLVTRLDMVDPSPVNYWSETLPDIEKRIMLLPGIETKSETTLIEGGKNDGAENDGEQGSVSEGVQKSEMYETFARKLQRSIL